MSSESEPTAGPPQLPPAGGNHPRLRELDSVLEDQPLAGVPDAFSRLWTPHRMAYIGGADKPATGAPEQCPFCLASQRSDEDGLIVFRGQYAFVLLNLYPYNSGHLLICPYRHVSDYPQLTAAERVEIGELTAQAMRVLRVSSQPHGFNLGMNQGAVAGAGIAAHLHQHVVPRWGGDANFFPIIARTKAVPELLGDARERLAKAWTQMEQNDPTEQQPHGNAPTEASAAAQPDGPGATAPGSTR